MKESRFNLYFNAPDGARLAFNSLSCALAMVDADYQALLEALPGGVVPDMLSDVLAAARKGNFVVDTDKDEVLDYETKRTAQKFSATSLGLTIAPTLDCNFRCVYCYETRRKGRMSAETRQNVVRFVGDRIKGLKKVEVTWYGGEPLLCMDIIKELSKEIREICEKEGVPYHAFIITNGYLLTPGIIADFKDCAITGAQITIDGPREIHEARRVSRNGGKSFDAILDNVNMALGHGQEIILRVNVDRSNEAAVGILIEELARRLVSKEVKITFGQVSAYTEACRGIESACYSNGDFAGKMLEYYRLLEQHGFGSSNKFPYPFVKLSYCCAEQLLSFVIDPEGEMYKCWNDVGHRESAVGNVNALRQDVANDRCGRWLCRILPEKCKSCSILPICAGGCPHVTNVLGKSNACDYIKYNIEATMLEYYAKFLCKGA